MEAATDLWRMGAMELAQAIRARRTSNREVIESHLRRIEAVNPLVNAVTFLLAEEALHAADAADFMVAAGGNLPPLLGVPFTVKGNIDLLLLRPPRVSRCPPRHIPPGTPRLSSGSGPREPSPSVTRTWPIWPCAGTASVKCGVRRSTPLDRSLTPVPPPVARPRP